MQSALFVYPGPTQPDSDCRACKGTSNQSTSVNIKWDFASARPGEKKRGRIMFLNLKRLSVQVGTKRKKWGTVFPDLRGLPTRALSTLLLLMLLCSLGDVGVADQAAEQRGNLRSNVQLLLEWGKGWEVKWMSLVLVHWVAEILGNKRNWPQTEPGSCRRSHSSCQKHQCCWEMDCLLYDCHVLLENRWEAKL